MRKVYKNILGIGFFKLLSVVLNFVLVGLTYRYLENEKLNGLWLTILSILTWILVFDFGIGNGLRNKLTVAFSNNNKENMRNLIFNCYIAMLFPTGILIFSSIIFSKTVDWSNIFNLKDTGELADVNLIFTIVTLLYVVHFYFTLVNPILHAIYKSYVVSLLNTITVFFQCCIILLLIYFKNNDEIGNLLLLSILYLLAMIVVNFIATIYTLKGKELSLKFSDFSRRDINWLLIKDIFALGFKFLIPQIAIIILFNTDNILISKYVGLESVNGFFLMYKITGIFTLTFSIILTPFWTLISSLYTNRQWEELKRTILKIFSVYLILLILLISFSSLYDDLIYWWAGDRVSGITDILTISMVIFTILHMWSNMFQYVYNGLGILKIQTYLFGLASLVNIPISIYLIGKFPLYGATPIIWGTIISLLFPSLGFPLYSKYLLKINKKL